MTLTQNNYFLSTKLCAIQSNTKKIYERLKEKILTALERFRFTEKINYQRIKIDKKKHVARDYNNAKYIERKKNMRSS